MNSEILIYQNHDGNIKIDVRLEEETIWLTQDQMATLFGKGRSTITEHIGNVYEERELELNRTCRKFRQVRQEGSLHHLGITFTINRKPGEVFRDGGLQIQAFVRHDPIALITKSTYSNTNYYNLN